MVVLKVVVINQCRFRFMHEFNAAWHGIDAIYVHIALAKVLGNSTICWVLCGWGRWWLERRLWGRDHQGSLVAARHTALKSRPHK
jgi:hypothetical protein